MENLIIPKPGTIYSDTFAEGSDGNYYRKVNGVWTLIDMGEGLNITNIDCSENPLCPIIKEKQMLRVTVEGLFGGEDGPEVEKDDLIICLADNDEEAPWEDVSEKFFILQSDIQPTNLRELIKGTTFTDGIKILDTETERITLKKVGEGGDTHFIVEYFDKTKDASTCLLIKAPILSNEIELFGEVDEEEVKLAKIKAFASIGETEEEHVAVIDPRDAYASLLARLISSDGQIRALTSSQDGFQIKDINGNDLSLRIGNFFSMINEDQDKIQDYAGRMSFNAQQKPTVWHDEVRAIQNAVIENCKAEKITNSFKRIAATLWSDLVTPEATEIKRFNITSSGIMPGQDEINGVIFNVNKYLPDYVDELRDSVCIKVDVINALNLPVKYRFVNNAQRLTIYDYAGTEIGSDIVLEGNVGSTIKALIIRDLVETEPEVYVEVQKVILLPCEEMQIYNPQ